MLRNAIAVVCLMALMGSDLSAQVLYGSIVGNVSDSTDAAVAGALVTIKNKETGQSRETTTNESGGYAFPDVASGGYDVRIAKEGFTAMTRTDVPVTINNTSRVNITLQVRRVRIGAGLGADWRSTDRSFGSTIGGDEQDSRKPSGPARTQLSATVSHASGIRASGKCAFHPVKSYARAHLQCERNQPQLE